MKKIAFMCVALLFFACNSKQSAPEMEVDIIEAEIMPEADMHNAQNSLDYRGSYQGTLPTASGSGMNIIITLADSTYTKEITYIEQEDKFSSKGKYTWNAEGNTITLIGENAPNQYFIGENMLIQLDSTGHRINGEMEDNYVLRKEDI